MHTYVIITPVRNEEKYIEQTIRSVLEQTIKPKQWIIVDDGSSDQTPEIIDKYAMQVPWITTIKRSDRGYRKSGVGVMEAFFDGYNSLNIKEFDFIIKLDGDLKFKSDYFESCIKYFIENSKLGIAGGSIYCYDLKGRLTVEKAPLFHVRGATKIYRKECWDLINDLLHCTGWDTIDEIKAIQLGWQTRSLPDVPLIQLRSTGGVNGVWKDWVKNGVANYVSGYHPLFVIIKCLKHIFTKPYFLVSVALCYGFISGYLGKTVKTTDKSMIKFLRNQQMRRVLLRSSIWK
jgi:glycosyltransferase involved in cell wall biosynthesis